MEVKLVLQCLLLARFPPRAQQRNLLLDTQVSAALLGAVGTHQDGLSKLTCPRRDGAAVASDADQRWERSPWDPTTAVPKAAAAFRSLLRPPGDTTSFQMKELLPFPACDFTFPPKSAGIIHAENKFPSFISNFSHSSCIATTRTV